MTKTVKLLDSLVCDAHVWVAGKGPSLNKFDWSDAGRHRVGINQAAFSVPDCWAAIAIDYDREEEYFQLDPSIIVLRKRCHYQREFPIMFLWGIEIPIRETTAPVLFQILANSGAKVLHLIGFDSIDRIPGYASPHWAPPDYAGRKEDYPKQRDYDKINNYLLQIAEDRGLELIWEHRLL